MNYRQKRRAPRSTKRRIVVRIVDRYAPKQARWALQRAIQRAAGFDALRGLTDDNTRRGRPHAFWMNKARFRRFASDIAPLLARNRINASIDGKLLRIVRR